MSDVFHIPTLTLSLAATLVILAGFLTLLWAHDRGNRALKFWSLGFSSGALGMVLVSLREFAPPFVALGLGNALGIYSLGLIWLGCLAFDDVRQRGAGFIAAAGAVLWLGLFAMPTFSSDLGARVLVASVLYAVYSFLSVPVLLCGQRKEPLPARVVALIAFGVHGATYVIRFPMQLREPVQIVDGFAPLWFGTMTFGSFLQGLVGALAIFAMVHERSTRRYKQASETDGLTSLLNRRAFLEAVTKDRSDPDRAGAGAVIAVVDADHFKAINDTYGHGAGDAALVQICGYLLRSLPEGSVAGRLGGEEFGLYLPSDVVKRHPDLLEDLRRGVSHTVVEHEPAFPIVTVSIGATSVPAGPLDFSRALARADKALYASKEAGRNRVTWSADEQGKGEVAYRGIAVDLPSQVSLSAA